jgi:hypothetical protein
LSKKCLDHVKNWRAHLKRESARCNRSFASLVFSEPTFSATNVSLHSLGEKLASRANLRSPKMGV